MHYIANPIAIFIFLVFVGFVLGMSFYMARKTKSASGYFAAGGTIHWFVNGIAFVWDLQQFNMLEYATNPSLFSASDMIVRASYGGCLVLILITASCVVMQRRNIL